MNIKKSIKLWWFKRRFSYYWGRYYEYRHGGNHINNIIRNTDFYMMNFYKSKIKKLTDTDKTLED